MAKKVKAFKVGDILPSKNGGDFLIVEIKNYKCVTIEFVDDHKFRMVAAGHRVQDGGVKNPYSPTVHGKGFIGDGKFSPCTHKSYYKRWKRMMERCYCPKSLLVRQSYRDCEVCNEWLNFQNFAAWLEGKPNHQHSFELDKDLFSNGLKIYSPSTCTLLPAQINSTLYTDINIDELKPSPKTGSYSFRVEAHACAIALCRLCKRASKTASRSAKK